MRTKVFVFLVRTALSIACCCLLFLGITVLALPDGRQSATFNCNVPGISGRLRFHVTGKWENTQGTQEKFDVLHTLYIDDMVDLGDGKSRKKTAAEKAEEIYNYAKDIIPKVDHDGNPDTPPEPLYAVSWSGGSSTIVEFKLPHPNETHTSDLRISSIKDGTNEDDSIDPAAPLGYSILAEFVGDITGQVNGDPSQPSRVRLGINGTVAEVTLSGEWTREALAREMAEKLLDLGIRASVVRDTIVHIQTPSDTHTILSYGNTDRGLEVWVDITD